MEDGQHIGQHPVLGDLAIGDAIGDKQGKRDFFATGWDVAKRPRMDAMPRPAHIDQVTFGDELLRFLKPTLVSQTEAYVVHGEVDQAEAFAQRLIAAGVGRATVPATESSAVAYSGQLQPPPAHIPGKTDQD